MDEAEALEFSAKLFFLFAFLIAGFLLAAGKTNLSAWVTIVGGAVITLVEMYAQYLNDTRDE